MPQENEERAVHLLEELLAFARERLPAAGFSVVEPFLRHYYDQADTDDLIQRDIADLYGAVMAHWQTAQKFVPGSARIRVYNPNLEEHGWHPSVERLFRYTGRPIGDLSPAWPP